MDVGTWLRGLGLRQYEGTFRESEIEADVLPELTEADLEKLGLPLGPRKRILKAIANLADADKASGAASLARPSPEDAAERRQLTVMFCDLAGSTALSARLDPEDFPLIALAAASCSNVSWNFSGSFAAQNAASSARSTLLGEAGWQRADLGVVYLICLPYARAREVFLNSAQPSRGGSQRNRRPPWWPRLDQLTLVKIAPTSCLPVATG